MKWWLKLGLAIVIVVVIAFLGISGYLGYTMTRAERVPLEGNPGLLGLAYEDVSFPSMNEKFTLRGWFLPAQDNHSVIILMHGEGSHRADPSVGILDIASQLVKNGYNVLMFDLRGHGESDGNMKSAGYYEKEDLTGAVEYVKGHGFDSIGVIGFSMGASTALITAAENKDIDAIVADSSFADLQDIMEPEFSKRSPFPTFFLQPLLFMVKIMYGVDFNAIRPIECVPEIAPRPIFFIHGELDETIPVEHARRLYQASLNTDDQLWIAPEVDHVRAYITYPEEYISKITTFFDNALR